MNFGRMSIRRILKRALSRLLRPVVVRFLASSTRPSLEIKKSLKFGRLRIFAPGLRALARDAVFLSTTEQNPVSIANIICKLTEVPEQNLASALIDIGHSKLPDDDMREVSERLPVFKWGSCVQGIPEWEHRWATTPAEKRILFFAQTDFSGSLFKLAEAVNTSSDYAARLLVTNPHKFGYMNDLVFLEGANQRLDQLLEDASEATFFVLKDEQSWFSGDGGRFPLGRANSAVRQLFFREIPRSRKAFCLYGGFSRRFENDDRWQQAVMDFGTRLAFTADLCFDWVDADLLPHAINVEAHDETWSRSHILSHSTSSPLMWRKGGEIFSEGLRLIERQNPPGWQGWQVEYITGVPFQAAMERKRKAELYFDQAGREGLVNHGRRVPIGTYGNAALEAMALGIPTIVHLSSKTLESAAKAGLPLEDSPLMRIERSGESLAATITQYLHLSDIDKQGLSMRTREFAANFHGYRAVSERLISALTSRMESDKR